MKAMAHILLTKLTYFLKIVSNTQVLSMFAQFLKDAFLHLVLFKSGCKHSLLGLYFMTVPSFPFAHASDLVTDTWSFVLQDIPPFGFDLLLPVVCFLIFVFSAHEQLDLDLGFDFFQTRIFHVWCWVLLVLSHQDPRMNGCPTFSAVKVDQGIWKVSPHTFAIKFSTDLSPNDFKQPQMPRLHP